VPRHSAAIGFFKVAFIILAAIIAARLLSAATDGGLGDELPVKPA